MPAWAGLLHRPRILFMDEPTVGIDPQSRRNILDMVKEDLVATYKLHTPLPPKEISDLMSAETYLSAADAVEKGFATNLVKLSNDEADDNPQPDDVLNPEQQKAYLDLIEFEMVASDD